MINARLFIRSFNSARTIAIAQAGVFVSLQQIQEHDGYIENGEAEQADEVSVVRDPETEESAKKNAAA